MPAEMVADLIVEGAIFELQKITAVGGSEAHETGPVDGESHEGGGADHAGGGFEHEEGDSSKGPGDGDRKGGKQKGEASGSGDGRKYEHGKASSTDDAHDIEEPPRQRFPMSKHVK